MRTNRKMLLGAIAAAVMVVSAGAFAQTPPCIGAGPGMTGWGGGPGMMGGGPGYGPGAGQRGAYGPGPGAGSGGPRGAGPAVGPAARAELRLARLKDDLKLTRNQQAAFDAYAEKVKASAAQMEAFRAVMFENANANPGERYAQRAEHMKQRASQIETVGAAYKDLYATLTPEQKAIADAYHGGRFAAAGGPQGPGRWR